jgi:sugar transferase (PEP-CTERM system associated)
MLRVFQRYLAFRKIGTILIEHISLVACVLYATQIRLHQSPFAIDYYEHPLLKAVVIALTFQFFLHLRDVYDDRRTPTYLIFFGRLGQALLLAAAALCVLYYLAPDLLVGRGILLISVLLTSAFLTLWHSFLRMYRGFRPPRSNVVVLGTGPLARELVAEVLRRPELGIKICGFLDGNPALVGTSVVNPKVLGLYSDLPMIVSANRVDRVVVELQDRRGCLPIQMLLQMKVQGIAVEDATSFYERVTGKIALENLKPSWMIFNPGFEASRSVTRPQTILSFVASLMLLLLFMPVMLLIIIAVRLDSKGPAFFSQERTGQGGRVFTVWKFRSMQRDAEQHTGPTWAKQQDERVTRVGRFLRRSRLDELPQLWNVLRGDMSLVGPRPERPVFVQQLQTVIPFYNLRHTVKPGLTGWAQINYEYGSSVEDAVEKLQYDLFYIKHMSWVLDTLIAFETIKTILVRRGS